MEDNIAPSIFDETLETQPVVYATLGQRFVNFIIDYIVFRIVTAVIFILLGVALALGGWSQDRIQDIARNNYYIAALMGIVLYLATYSLVEGVSKGRSVGKLITKTAVLRADLSPITLRDAFLRSLCRMVPFDPVSIFFNLENSMWHDRWTKTIVVKNNRINLLNSPDNART